MSNRDGGSSRWGNKPSNTTNQQKPVSDDQALEALLASAESRKEQQQQQESSSSSKPQRTRWDEKNETSSLSSKPNSNKPSDDYYQPQSKRQRSRFNNDEKNDSKHSWGGGEDAQEENGERDDEEAEVEKQKPNFGLSGALANDDKTGNVYNGIVLKFSEPPEARVPNTRWRFYVFKKKIGASEGDDGDLLEVMHISKQSAYLFGREAKVADISVQHASLSKQHCVLQYRTLPDKNDREHTLRCKPYLMDLGSTNGTFINGVRIEDARYYELRKGDVITLGSSTREYVLLTENTTSADL